MRVRRETVKMNMLLMISVITCSCQVDIPQLTQQLATQLCSLSLND